MATNREKQKAAAREVGYRRHVYARRVAAQQMTQAKAELAFGGFFS